EIQWNESLSVAIFYNDTALNKLIEGADVTLTGTGIDKELERDGDYYNVTIEAGALEVGTSLLTIAAKKTNYSSEYTTITVTVKSRETDFTRLDLNEENKIEEESITLFWNETLSVGVVINDSSTNHFVQGVDFHLTGTDISVVLSEEGGIYTGSIEAGELPVGTTRLTLEGSLNNYSIEDLRITVNVNERETFLGYEEPENVPYEDNVTLEVWFRDLELNSSINPATIRVSNSSDSEYWEPFSDYLVTFNDSEEKYIVEFNSTIFADEGAFPIYITANRTNYETAKERIFITIDARESDFILEVFDLEDKRYLDRTADPTLERDVNQTVDIRFNYTDISGKSLDGASVKIRIDETWENLTYNDTAGYHNISFSAGPNTLDRTFNTLPIRAEKNGYESQEIILEVQIIERKTNITLYINGDDKTDEPVVDFYYGQTFNISVNYTDYYTGEPISNPDIELLGDYIANLTYDEIQIDTTDLDIGMNFITVSASRDNYERKTISLVVQVQRIRGEIYIEDNIKTFKAEPGDDITITLELRDVYNDSISDATVTYTSNIINEDLRNGIFTQIDEGVYEVTLNEVPEGVYTLIISVTFEDPEKLRIYRVEDYDINLEVKRPEEEIFLLRALSIGGTIAAIGAIGYLIAYQKVLKYPKPVRKVRRFKKKLKKKKIDESEYQSRKSAFRESYRESIDPSISKKLGPKSKPKKK
ncbi:MAG: hypothetical protein ACOC44_20020, partial [Promethearchaeia archaeon]